jgi:hypothetical protein
MMTVSGLAAKVVVLPSDQRHGLPNLRVAADSLNRRDQCLDVSPLQRL